MQEGTLNETNFLLKMVIIVLVAQMVCSSYLAYYLHRDHVSLTLALQATLAAHDTRSDEGRVMLDKRLDMLDEQLKALNKQIDETQVLLKQAQDKKR